MNYSDKALDELIKHYREAFGVCLAFEDAIWMMVLIEMLGEVFERYETGFGPDMPELLSPLFIF
jgi:hypothetical protein